MDNYYRFGSNFHGGLFSRSSLEHVKKAMKKTSFFSILFAVAGLAVAGLISYSAFKETRRTKIINQEIEKLRLEAEKLRQNNKEMQEKIVYFETPEFQERIAKEKLNLQKEDENVTVVKPSPTAREKNVEESEKIKPMEKFSEQPNYKKWWNYFFKY